MNGVGFGYINAITRRKKGSMHLMKKSKMLNDTMLRVANIFPKIGKYGHRHNELFIFVCGKGPCIDYHLRWYGLY